MEGYINWNYCIILCQPSFATLASGISLSLSSQPPMKRTTSMLPSLSSSVTSTYYGVSGTGIIESIDANPTCTLQYCAGDSNTDSICVGDLVCYQKK